MKTELAWSVIGADNFGVGDNVHFLTQGCCIQGNHHTVVSVLLQIQGARKG